MQIKYYLRKQGRKIEVVNRGSFRDGSLFRCDDDRAFFRQRQWSMEDVAEVNRLMKGGATYEDAVRQVAARLERWD